MNNKLRIKLLGAAMGIALLSSVSFTGCKTPTPVAYAATSSTNAWGGTVIFPPPVPGTALCGSYCGYVVYNNSGSGFSPTCSPCSITVRANGVIVPASCYEVLWRYSATQRGCALPYTDTQKQYNNVSGKRYTYTVYFKPSCCPPTGTSVEISVECIIGGTSSLKLAQPDANKTPGLDKILKK